MAHGRKASDWEFVLALPNLRLPLERDDGDAALWPGGIDLGSGMVSLFGGEDMITRTVRVESSQVEHILGSFKDENDVGYAPAALLVRKDAPVSVRESMSAFTDFRNAVAISMLLPGRCAAARGEAR